MGQRITPPQFEKNFVLDFTFEDFAGDFWRLGIGGRTRTRTLGMLIKSYVFLH